MVDVFEIRGKVDLDLEPFTSKIKTANEQLMELGKGINLNFLEKNDFLGKIDLLKDKLGQVGIEAEKISNAFTKIEGLGRLLEQLDLIKEKVGTVKTEVESVNNSANNVARATVQWSEALSTVSPNFQNMIHSLEMVNAKEQQRVGELGKIGSELVEEGSQIKKNTTYYEQELQVAKQFKNAQEGLIRGYVEQGQAIERANALEKQRLSTLRQEMNVAKQLGNAYLKNTREQNRQLTYEREMLVVEEQFSTVIGDEIASKFQYNNLLQESAVLEKEILSLMGNQATMTGEEIAEETKKLNSLRQELDLEREILATEKQQTAEESKQTKERLSGASASAKGNQLDKMGYLPSRIGSMAVTMWGFNEIMDIYEKSMANINAQGQMKTYTDLMKTDNRYLTQTKQNVNDVTTGLNDLNKSLYQTYKGGDSLQKMYQKVDMTQVGANAMDTAFKYGVQAENLDDLTEVMAIYGSEFVRQGRSQEDSILAVNDALDGELRRLKEVGIDKEDLEAKGWDGTTETMITALREIAEERGYDVIAQKITNLSDAITVLEIRIAQDLVGAFKTVEPVLVEVAKDFMLILDAMEWVFDKLKGAWNDLGTELDKTFGVQKVQKATGGLLKIVGVAITLGITFGIVYKVVKALRGVLSSVFSIFGKGTDEIAKTTGDIAKTGGTVAKDSGGGFKENFKTQWSKLGKDLGKMARAFFVVAVGMAMAFALVEEGIILISGIGYTYDSLKPQFESGINFIKEFGLWFALLGGAMLVLSYAFSKVSDSAMESIGKGAVKLATGMAIAMGLVAVAIGSLLMPMGAIIGLGALANWQQGNLDKGIEVIQMFADALNQITLPVGIFIGALLVASVILGYAPMLGVGLAVGIAVSIGLVAEAIGLLVLPLGAIALLGGTASVLGEENINKGAETIAMIGRVLKVLSDAMVDLFVVDIATLGVMLTEKASQLITGKTGLQALTDDIIPNLTDFIKRFNGLEMGEPVDQAKVQAVIQMTNDLPPLFNAVQRLNNAMGTTNVIGNIGGALGGAISGAMGMGLKGKLDQLYNDVKDVMDFATKLGGLSSTGGANASAVTQTANAITQLKAKLTLLVSTISGASARVKSASKTLGTGLKTGFTEGSSGFNTSVVSILAKGISEVQSRYNTWHSGGKTSAQKLTDGFKTFGGKIKSTIDTEMGYALDKLDEYKDDFYSKGQALGKQLSDGFESSGGLNVGSPANIARAIAQELKYSMDALNIGEQMMYKGGVALGRALTNGYGNSGNLRTNVGVLASKGVNNEQLQANANNVQVNAKKNQQTPQSLNPTINIDMSNSTVIGVQDLDTKIRQAVEKAIVSIHTSDGAIGY